MPAPIDNKARKPDAANGTGQNSRGLSSSGSAHAPSSSSPKPWARRENLNEAGGPRQGTNPYAPAPGTRAKDIPVQSGQGDDNQKDAVGPLDETAEKAKRREAQFNPTRPYDAALRRSGNEL